MRFDTSMENLMGIGRSESYVDLNNSDFAKSLLNSSSNLFAASTGTTNEEQKTKMSRTFLIK